MLIREYTVLHKTPGFLEVGMAAENENEYERLMKNRPHVVILGAGATIAAIPNGDKNGRKSSVMSGFIEALGMTETLKSVNLQTKSNNLEDIYRSYIVALSMIQSGRNSIGEFVPISRSWSCLTSPISMTCYS